jgi:hypothetical protein
VGLPPIKRAILKKRRGIISLSHDSRRTPRSIYPLLLFPHTIMPSLLRLSNLRSLVPVLLFLLAQHCINSSSSSSAVLAAIGAPLRVEPPPSSSPLLDDHLALRLHHHKEEEKPRSHRRFRRRVVRVLQEQDATTYYVADYVGRFHFTRHNLCTGPSSPALLTAACPLGGGRIELVRISHPDYIQCEMVVEDDDETNNATILSSSNMLRCTTTCPTVAACSNIFLSVADSPSVYDGPYGEIYFRCSGIDPLQSTTGSFNYVGSDQANLAATTGHCAPFISTTTTINTWNIRVAQLGTCVTHSLWCPLVCLVV